MKLSAVEEEGAEDEESDILGPDGDLKLGTLDITSTEVSLKGELRALRSNALLLA